jgi:hypothetical protein
MIDIIGGIANGYSWPSIAMGLLFMSEQPREGKMSLERVVDLVKDSSPSEPFGIWDLSSLKEAAEFQWLIGELKRQPAFFSMRRSEIARHPEAVSAIICAASQLDADAYFAFCEDVLASEAAGAFLNTRIVGYSPSSSNPSDLVLRLMLLPPWRMDRGILYRHQLAPRAARIILEGNRRLSYSEYGTEARGLIEETFFLVKIMKLRPLGVFILCTLPVVCLWWYRRSRGCDR